MSKRRIGSFLASLLLLAAAVLVIRNVQLIQDGVSYYQYSPDTTMATFAAETGMNDYGKFLFYASHPSLSDASSFNQQCGTPEQATAILGCYNGQRIYIYDITDPRLAGIRPTTAAHEMLHAAYIRLDNKERQYVDRLLEVEYDALKDREDLADRMSFYDRTQPGDHANELHSIIGTEVAELSTELEQHYSRYFADRSKVVAQHNRYRSVFDELRTRSDALKQRIDQMKNQVEGLKNTYETRAALVQSNIAAFNDRAKRGDFESQAEFTRERQILLSETAALDSLRFEINKSINDYNTLVAELNEIAIETNALNRSMDSNIGPAPSL